MRRSRRQKSQEAGGSDADGQSATLDRHSSGYFGSNVKKGKKKLLRSLFGKPQQQGEKVTPQQAKFQDLNKAIEEANVDEVKRLVSDQNIDEEINECMRLSDLAALLGNTQLLQVAIDNSAQINAANSSGQVPLHYAITSPDPPATVAFLLDNGARTDIPFPNGDFLLHKACSDSTTVLLELLLQHNTDLSCLDIMKNTPLHRACINDLKEHAEILTVAAPHLVNAQDNEGKTPLHIAVANQNIQLMKMLLDRGATIDKESREGLTPIDLMMTSKNRGALRELIFYFTDKVSKDVKAYKVQELYRSKHFHKFLSLLQLVDSEPHKCYCRSSADPEEENGLVENLIDLNEEGNQDVIEFQARVMAALMTNAIHEYTDNREVIDTIAIFTTKYILFREDVSMLQDVMRCGVVWQKVNEFLEQHIGTLYSKTNRDGSAISKLFVDNFVESTGKKKIVNVKKLSQRVAKCLGMAQLSCDQLAADAVLRIRNPVRTLAIWSILTGHLNFTLLFLSRTEFELIPLCLMAAGILRKPGEVYGSRKLSLQATADLAAQCEQMACDAASKAMHIDTSEDKRVTCTYLLQSMPAFGDLNCIHLAANCQCDTFLTLDVSQRAVDLKWYRFIGDLDPVRRELLVLLALIPLNPLVPLLLYRQNQDSDEAGKSEQADNLHASKESFAIQDADEATTAMFENELGNDSAVRATFTSKLAYILGLYYFFFQIPSVKFRYITGSHILLILVMSYVALIDFQETLTAIEIVAYAIAFGFVIEEVREIVMSIWRDSWWDYASNKWNIFDGLASLFMVTALALRLVMTHLPNRQIQFNNLFDDNIWFSARFFFALSCSLMWVKLLNVARVHEFFGPKLTMISKMIIRDLLPFMYILAVYICGFGVLMGALMHPNGYFAYNPNRQSLTEILQEMVHICFYSIFGEYHLDMMTGSGCEGVYQDRKNNSETCPHPASVFVVPYVLLPVYITITTILLLSLIVALFSKTIDEIDSNSRALWLFQRFSFVNEYENYSALPPPLNVFDMLWQAASSLCGRCLPKSDVEQEMSFFDSNVVVRHLINQAIGLRNCRRGLHDASEASDSR